MAKFVLVRRKSFGLTVAVSALMALLCGALFTGCRGQIPITAIQVHVLSDFQGMKAGGDYKATITGQEGPLIRNTLHVTVFEGEDLNTLRTFSFDIENSKRFDRKTGAAHIDAVEIENKKIRIQGYLNRTSSGGPNGGARTFFVQGQLKLVENGVTKVVLKLDGAY